MVTVVRAASDGSETLIDPETSPPIARSTRSDSVPSRSSVVLTRASSSAGIEAARSANRDEDREDDADHWLVLTVRRRLQ